VRLATATLFATTAFAVTTLKVQGADLVNSVTGAKFQIVGVAYQPGGSSGYDPASGVDPLSDGSVCLRDAALMQRLGRSINATTRNGADQIGVNAIRVYNVDPDLNHDMCASIFNEVRLLRKERIGTGFALVLTPNRWEYTC
jgi:hypothetical protein